MAAHGLARAVMPRRLVVPWSAHEGDTIAVRMGAPLKER